VGAGQQIHGIVVRMMTLFVFGILIVVVIGLIVAGAWAIAEATRRQRYFRTQYFQQTGTPYRKIITDKGKYGEFLTGERLDRLPGHHRMLFNLYLPKTDGTTTEVDLLFLHPSGIYVVESKNYSGYIFGSENDQRWTVSLEGGRRKEQFGNPIRQNAGHVAAFLRLLPQVDPRIVCSLIVFSERCKLAKVPTSTWDQIVVKRQFLESALRPRLGTGLLSDEQIDWLYSWLYPLTQANDTVKAAHIAQVQNRHPT